MAKKEDKPGDEGEEKKKKEGGRSNLIPALIVAVGLVVGGFLMGRGGGGAQPAAAAVAAPPTTEASGGVAMLPPVTMNLSDGKYLKVTMGLGLKKGKDPKAYLATGETAKALDLAIQQLAHYTSAELQPPDRRAEVKKHLADSVVEEFGGDVLHVYFTEWVVQ